MTAVAARPARTYSLGTRQRLGIAAALLGNPGVLVFDEPMNGLDPAGIRWFRWLAQGLASQGRTVLVSSHLLAEMALTATELVMIGRGRLIVQCPPTQLMAAADGATLEDGFLRLTRQNIEQPVGAAG